MSNDVTTSSILEDEENSLTMLDVLQEENALEEDANAVLGAADDQNCTYNKVLLVFNLKNFFFFVLKRKRVFHFSNFCVWKRKNVSSRFYLSVYT